MELTAALRERGARTAYQLDAASLGNLFEREADGLFGFLVRRTFDPDVALDLLGETFAVAFEKRNHFRGATQEEASAWLWAIGRRLLLRFFRKGRAERAALERLCVQTEPMSDDERSRVEAVADLPALRTRVVAELERLAPKHQAAVRLRVIDELPYPEVARRLGIAETAARARVSRALRALALALDDQKENSDA
jgi:RNA polymerase sigma-70 factor (ECF subfamily)